MNPYEVLELERDATTAQIKAARRRLAKQHHPDREGGDAEAMAQVNKAYDVLMDPDMRKQYDETGTIGIAGSFEEGAREVLRACLKECIMTGKLTPQLNLIAYIREKIAEAMTQAQDQQAKVPLALAATRARLEKIHSKGSETLLQDMLRNAIDGMEAQLKNLEKSVGVLDRAVELLDDYTDSTLEFAFQGNTFYTSPYQNMGGQGTGSSSSFFKRMIK